MPRVAEQQCQSIVAGQTAGVGGAVHVEGSGGRRSGVMHAKGRVHAPHASIGHPAIQFRSEGEPYQNEAKIQRRGEGVEWGMLTVCVPRSPAASSASPRRHHLAVSPHGTSTKTRDSNPVTARALPSQRHTMGGRGGWKSHRGIDSFGMQGPEGSPTLAALVLALPPSHRLGSQGGVEGR